MSKSVKIDASHAPKPVGLYPHARRVGNLLFLSGIGPRDPKTNGVPGLKQSASGNFEAFMDVKSVGIEPKPENLYRRRSVPFKQWLRQDVMRFFGMSNSDGTPLQIAVPYKYCSDTFAWGGNLTCTRFDMGPCASGGPSGLDPEDYDASGIGLGLSGDLWGAAGFTVWFR